VTHEHRGGNRGITGSNDPPKKIYFWVIVVFWKEIYSGQLILSKIINIVASSCQISRLKCTKLDFGWGCAPYPMAELTTLPQTS